MSCCLSSFCQLLALKVLLSFCHLHTRPYENEGASKLKSGHFQVYHLTFLSVPIAMLEILKNSIFPGALYLNTTLRHWEMRNLHFWVWGQKVKNEWIWGLIWRSPGSSKYVVCRTPTNALFGPFWISTNAETARIHAVSSVNLWSLAWEQVKEMDPQQPKKRLKVKKEDRQDQ